MADWLFLMALATKFRPDTFPVTNQQCQMIDG